MCVSITVVTFNRDPSKQMLVLQIRKMHIAHIAGLMESLGQESQTVSSVGAWMWGYRFATYPKITKSLCYRVLLLIFFKFSVNINNDLTRWDEGPSGGCLVLTGPMLVTPGLDSSHWSLSRRMRVQWLESLLFDSCGSKRL